MNVRDMLLEEFDLERPFTRRCLERVPEGKGSWKPHERSMTLGWLSTFLAVSPSWGVFVIDRDVLDPATAGGPGRKEAQSNAELLSWCDEWHDACRAALASATEDHLQRPWSLRLGDQVLFTRPRWLVLREYIFNHIVHHRAQLGIYLRMNDIALPAIYNDSADEQGGMFRSLG
jgi:uncharacterized damage-inducible protein DinB